MGAAFLGPLELCISNMRHAAGHRITCCSRWDVFLRQRDAHVLTVSGEWLGANALEFVGFLLVKRPAELEAVVAEGVGCESVHQVTGGPGPDEYIGIPQGTQTREISFIFFSSFLL